MPDVTTLAPPEEQKYRSWLQSIGMTQDNGFNVDQNFTGTDYDLRGFYKKYGPAKIDLAGGQHFTDEFKLPNHPTFSIESRFAIGPDARKAGRWNGDQFVPPSMTTTVDVPGVGVVEFPEGMSAAEIQGAIERDIAPQESGVEALGRNLRGIPRQVGLAGRYMVEGAAQLADLPNAVINAGLGLAGSDYRLGDLSAMASERLTRAGVPSPATPMERVVGDASRLLTGVGLTAGASAALAPASPVLASMAANTPAQAASAIGAGTAGGSVREAGGGPWEQFVASLLGGVLAPVSLGRTQVAGQAAGSAVRRALTPKEVAGEVQIAFERAGVDWKGLSANARTQLVDDAKAAVYSGQQLDEMAMRRLADYRNIGATPLLGDVTQDPGLLTRQRNLGKTQANMAVPVGPNISAIENQNAKAVLETLDQATVSPADAYATGEGLISKVKSVDRAIANKEGTLYDTARSAAGQDIPLNRREFIDGAFGALTKENKLAYLPGQVREMLNDISRGEITVNGQVHPTQFDVRTIDTLKTTLAAASRAAGKDGNAKRAISLVRQALENTQPEAQLPSFGGTQVATAADSAAINQTGQLPADALRLLDRARRLARVRFDWQKSAPFIEDALSGIEPDKFVQKHIISGSAENLAAVRKLVGGDPALREAVRGQLIAYIKQRGRADTDVTRFTSKGMEDALKALGDRKLTMWFKPQELSQIRSALRVAKYIQSQPIGSAVNNSNTAGVIMGKVLDVLVKSSRFVPLGEAVIGSPITSIRAGLNARQLQNVGKGLAIPVEKPKLPASALLLGAVVPPRQENRRH